MGYLTPTRTALSRVMTGRMDSVLTQCIGL